MANIAANSIGFQARLCPGEYLKARISMALVALLLLARAVEAGYRVPSVE
jgi:hypothetical protein